MARGPAWIAILLAALPLEALGQGIALRGASPVNESMAGTSVACPLDSAGAIHWNPATISGLPASDMSFGMEMILPNVDAVVDAPVPGVGVVSGSDRSEPGVTLVPSMAFVRKIENSPWSYGLGIYGIGGTSVNYPASSMTGTHNPVLLPQPFGVGPLAANVDVLQMAPAVSYALSERVSIGFAPTLTMGRVFASPLFLTDKDIPTPIANPNPPPALMTEYPPGAGTRYAFGGGFQAGIYWTTDSHWNYGASIKSPQWMEPFRFKSLTAAGAPVDVKFNLNYPLIASVGTAYTGFDKWIIACDLRYFDYANTLGFKHTPMSVTGAVTGLNWNNVMSVAVGAQRQLSDALSWRIGYAYNEDPIDSASAFFNIASPLIVQHSLHTGFSYCFADNWIVALTYVHVFDNQVSGPIIAATPAGNVAVPGTNVTTNAFADVLSMGFSKRF